MSIVFDYLKQIQEKKETGAPIASKMAVTKPVKTRFPLVGLGMGLLVVCAVIVTLSFVFMQGKGNPLADLKPKVLPDLVVTPAPASNADYVLGGIIYNPVHPFAIINGKMFEPKGRLDDYEVTSITPDTVILTNTKDNTSRTLNL